MGWVAVNPGNPSEPVSSSCFTRSDSITPLVQIQLHLASFETRRTGGRLGVPLLTGGYCKRHLKIVNAGC